MSEAKLTPPKEIILQGVAASPGTVVGKGFVSEQKRPTVSASSAMNDRFSDHLRRFNKARERLHTQWLQLAEEESSEESKAIFEAQIEIINDPELADRVKKEIKESNETVGNAINIAFKAYMDVLAAAENSQMGGRLIDLSDIRDRLIEAAGSQEQTELSGDGDILIAHEISPREVVELAGKNIKGFVTEKGGHTSHAAIIARSMGIPAVVGIKNIIRHLDEDTTICLNGENGLVTLNPSTKTCEQARMMAGGVSLSEAEKRSICERPHQTTDKHDFTLRANLEFPEELHHAEQYRAEGIGLLRTESMYMARESFGSCERQAAYYRKFLDRTVDAPVVIRLFDVGGDKLHSTNYQENNPFLGWRGIRMLLDEREILRNQLKAILIVAQENPGRVRLLVPMVSSMREIKEVKKEIKRCKQELGKDHVSPELDLPLGIMVEIPAAAVHADYFAKEVDFFSIGTNDLTQYLLAVDRGNAFISGRYDQRHPAVWKTIHYVAKAARKNDTEIGICGVLASYPVPAACLIGLGITALSMTPVGIPRVKKVLTERSFDDMQALGKKVLQSDELDEVKHIFKNW